MSKQAGQDLKAAVDKLRQDNPDYDQDLAFHNQISEILSNGKPPMLMNDDEQEIHAKQLALAMGYYYQSKKGDK
jgi:hypothetical protein|tara:strand:+ start:423 stop:644 length:222 start_codon:yes stop_codon:yes gene_type:complete